MSRSGAMPCVPGARWERGEPRRSRLGKALEPSVAERAAEVGLELVDLGLKDLVLPGEMKALLNRVTSSAPACGLRPSRAKPAPPAQKEPEANVILRREETAATRSMAQTAKVLAENPLLVRLEEMEAYKELAGKVGTLHVVMGDTALGKLELKV